MFLKNFIQSYMYINNIIKKVLHLWKYESAFYICNISSTFSRTPCNCTNGCKIKRPHSFPHYSISYIRVNLRYFYYISGASVGSSDFVALTLAGSWYELGISISGIAPHRYSSPYCLNPGGGGFAGIKLASAPSGTLPHGAFLMNLHLPDHRWCSPHGSSNSSHL